MIYEGCSWLYSRSVWAEVLSLACLLAGMVALCTAPHLWWDAQRSPGGFPCHCHDGAQQDEGYLHEASSETTNWCVPR